MHDGSLRDQALTLFAAGMKDRAVAEALGLPRTTVRDWRLGGKPKVRSSDPCPRCWQPMQPAQCVAGDYAELLGLYLGDGHISRYARTQRLRLSLDAKYPVIVADSRALLERCFPRNRVSLCTADRAATVVLSVYWSHLACLFPQHGLGKKHDRRVVLERWQDAIVAEHPWRFIRGCLRSDGCAFINRTGRYEYLSYDFANHSPDVLDAFGDACTHAGVDFRRYRRCVRIYRRASVAEVLEHVGLKA